MALSLPSQDCGPSSLRGSILLCGLAQVTTPVQAQDLGSWEGREDGLHRRTLWLSCSSLGPWESRGATSISPHSRKTWEVLSGTCS